MRVQVTLMRRRGVRLSDSDFANTASIAGELAVAYVGHVQVAMLNDPAAPVGPSLYQVTLDGVTGNCFTLRGIERIRTRDGDAAVIQEWRCEIG